MTFETPEDILEHFGVKGMHWGVRKARRVEKQNARVQKRVDAVRRVAEGGGNRRDKIRVSFSTTTFDALMSRNNQEMAQRTLNRMQKHQSKILAGKRKTQDILARAQGVRYRDLDFSYTAPTTLTKRKVYSDAEAKKILDVYFSKNFKEIEA